MTSATATIPAPRFPSARAVLRGAAIFWWLMAVLGQWAFLYYIAVFYGLSSIEGNFAAWTRNHMLLKSYVPGDAAGNLAFGAHALLAGYIAFGGALQLVPQIRACAPSFHRWNGRAFLVIAFGLSLSGLYLVWVREFNWGKPDWEHTIGAVAISLNALLIVTFATFAWRMAAARNFASHRHWAMRLYLVANAQWFTRIGFMAWSILNGLAGGPDSLDDVFFRIWQFGCYLLPLAVLELYLWTTRSGAPRAQYGMAVSLIALTLIMGVGIFGAAMLLWRPLLVRS